MVEKISDKYSLYKIPNVSSVQYANPDGIGIVWSRKQGYLKFKVDSEGGRKLINSIKKDSKHLVYSLLRYITAIKGRYSMCHIYAFEDNTLRAFYDYGLRMFGVDVRKVLEQDMAFAGSIYKGDYWYLCICSGRIKYNFSVIDDVVVYTDSLNDEVAIIESDKITETTIPFSLFDRNKDKFNLIWRQYRGWLEDMVYFCIKQPVVIWFNNINLQNVLSGFKEMSLENLLSIYKSNAFKECVLMGNVLKRNWSYIYKVLKNKQYNEYSGNRYSIYQVNVRDDTIIFQSDKFSIIVRPETVISTCMTEEAEECRSCDND